MRIVFFLVFCLTLTTLVACVPKPKRDYTLKQITRLDSLKELMRINAHYADPLFTIRYQPLFTEPEMAAAERAAERVMATSSTIRERFAAGKPAKFGELAGRLRDGARDLMVAAQAERAADITTALDDMRDTCKECHKTFR